MLVERDCQKKTSSEKRGAMKLTLQQGLPRRSLASEWDGKSTTTAKAHLEVAVAARRAPEEDGGISTGAYLL